MTRLDPHPTYCACETCWDPTGVHDQECQCSDCRHADAAQADAHESWLTGIEVA